MLNKIDQADQKQLRISMTIMGNFGYPILYFLKTELDNNSPKISRMEGKDFSQFLF